MNKDSPIALAAVQTIILTLLDYTNLLTYPMAIIVLLLGTIYLIWRIEE